MAHANKSTRSRLNDVAISLMEQNCFLQAFDTLTEALEIDIAGDSDVEIASRRLLSPEPFPKAPRIGYSSVFLKDIASTAKGVECIFDKFARTDDEEGLELLTSIRLGDEVVSEELETALIEYNSGIAHQAYAIALLTRRKRIASENEAQTAALFLKTAEKTLANIHAASEQRKGSKDYACRTLPLRLVVLMSLHRLVLGTPEENVVQKALIEIHGQIMALAKLFDRAERAISPPEDVDGEEILAAKPAKREAALSA